MLNPRILLTVFIFLLSGSVLFGQKLIRQEYFDNGNLRLSVYKMGKAYHYVSYYESGKIMETGRFKEGKRNGKFERWFENGVRQVNISFSRNSVNGIYSVWDENGQLLLEANYNNGKLLKGSMFDSSGNLVASR